MDSLIFLARLCPSFPIIWKLFWLVVWPVWLLWWWMAEGPSGALCIFHQRSWRFPLCTHHHSLGPHIGTNRWHHFGWPLDLCPWGRPAGFWWFCHLWSEFGCHTYHRSFWYFHKDLVCRVWQCAPYFCTSWLADWALLLPPSLTCLEDLLILFSTLSKAHLGYL